jgi:hypothetical protein
MHKIKLEETLSGRRIEWLRYRAQFFPICLPNGDPLYIWDV